jgi:SOS response regulatory protein OraA/RecX
MDRDAYVDGLKLAAGRELSETQVRQRLARKGHTPSDIDAAIARLKEERAIDDLRVAETIARTETSTRRRGRLRVRMQIERAGISPATARKAVDDVFGELDADALLDAALTRRMLGRDRIEDDKEFQRLYRYLLNQGFDGERVLSALRARRKK